MVKQHCKEEDLLEGDEQGVLNTCDLTQHV